MKVAAAISSPAQDDFIQRIFEHINRWDNPWTRARKARGSPNPEPPTAPSRGRAVELNESIDPQWDVDAYITVPTAPLEVPANH
jgi:hypothetical protein